MKRLNRFVLLTLGYLVAIAVVAGRRMSILARIIGKSSKQRKAVMAIVAASLIAVLSTTTAAPANAYTQGTTSWKTVKVGGATATVTTGQCSNTELVRGFRLHSDSNTGVAFALSMALRCGDANPDLNGWSGSTNHVQFFGSSPGETGYDSMCADGSFAYGVAAKTNRGTSGTLYINDLAPLCREIKTNATTATPATKPTGATPNEFAECGTGEYLLGLKLQTGSAVDAIVGLKCARYTFVQNSPTNLSVTHTNGNTVTVSFVDNSHVDNGYRVFIYDALGTTEIGYADTTALTATGSTGSVTFSTSANPALRCGLAFVAKVVAMNPSGNLTTLNSDTVSATSTAATTCKTSSVSVSDSATSNLWWDTSSNSYKAISNANAGVLNVDELKGKLQAGTNTTIDSGGALTFSSALTATGTTCGNLTVGSPDSSVMLNAAINLSTCASGKPLVVKAATDILVYSDITTNAGAITLWSDTDGGSARGGGIKTGTGTTISSTGGAISLSGGADNTTSWAKGTSITDDFGISLAGTVNAGGGNITIRGEEASDLNRPVWTDRAGVNFNKSSSTTTSGSGTITVDGKADATNADITKFHHGVVIGGGEVANLATISSATGAISIRGDASANSGQNRRGILMYRASVTSTSGAMTLEGLGNTATGSLAFHFYDSHNTVGSSNGGAVLLKSNADVKSTFYDGSVSSAGGVTLQLSAFSVYAGRTLTLGGTGAKVIESTSTENSFGAAVNLTGLAVSSDSTSVRIGKSTNTAALTLGTAWTVAGPLDVNAGSITLNTSSVLSSAGAMTLTATAGDIGLSSNTIVTGSGNKLLLKATGAVNSAAAITQRTNGGHLIIWSDSDTSGSGAVAIYAGSTLSTDDGANSRTSTTSGQIYVAGGADSDSDGFPDGFAVMASGGNACGISSGFGGSNSSLTSYYSGNGAIYFNGKSAAGTDGTCFNFGTSMYANGGTITLKGVGTTGLGLQLSREPGTTATSNFVSNSATNPAISMSGQSDSAWGFLSGYYRTTANSVSIQATGAGGISLSGRTGGATSNGYGDVNLNSTNVLSASGQIRIASNSTSTTTGGVLIGGTTTSTSLSSTSTFGSCAGGTCPSSLVTSSTANVVVTSDAWFGYSNSTTVAVPSQFNTAGTVSITPKASTGFAYVSTVNMAMASTVSGITMGTDQSGNNTGWSLSTPWSIAGPISIHGGGVTVAANMTITGAGNKFLMKNTGDIATGANVTVQTNGGAIVLWSNSDKVATIANNTGRIYTGSGTTLRSQGGPIYLAGGLDDGGGDASITMEKGALSTMQPGDGYPDGYGVGLAASGTTMGVYLGSNYTISSAGGDVFIAGMSAPTSDTGASYSLQLVDGLIDSGTGRIGIWAKAYANATDNAGLVLHASNSALGSVITSANRTAQAITLYSDSSANTNAATDGITAAGHSTGTTQYGWQSVQLIATGLKDSADLANKPGGGINVTGIATSTASWGGHGIVWQWADALAKDGPIVFNGKNVEGAGGYAGAGIFTGDNNYSTQAHWGAWHSALSYTNLAGTVTDFSTSSSNIELNADKFVFYESRYGHGSASKYFFITSGDITVQSVGSTFTSNQMETDWQFLNISISGSPRNVTIGKSTDTSQFFWWADINATGSISFYGKYVFLTTNTDLITTMAASGTATRNTGILLKSTERTYLQTNNILQTGGADITLWQDRDGDGLGALYAEPGAQLKSNGGNITIAGGADDGAVNNTEITGRTANDDAPDNYSGGYYGWGAGAGVDITGGTYQVLSAGGDIFIAGRGSATAGDNDFGVLLRGGLMYSNAGKIAIYGKSPASCSANEHRGIGIGWNGDGGRADSIISNSSASDAIKLHGDMTSCNNGGYVAANAIQNYFSAGSNIVTPNGGGITLYGKQGNASYAQGSWGSNYQESSILELNWVNVLSNSGPIEITGARVSGSGNHSVRFTTRGYTQYNNIGASTATIDTGFDAYRTINVTSSTSNVSVTGDSLMLYQAFFRNTGDLTLQPYAANFDRRQYFATDWAAYFPNTYKNVRIGKAGTNGSDQSSADVDLDRFAATGSIAVYGGNINVKNGLTTSATSGDGILVKGTNTITFQDGTYGSNTTTQVTGTNSTAPITIWANSDASGEGRIYVRNYNDIATRAGNITLGGSAVATDTSPGSYAVSTSGSLGGVSLGSYNGVSNANVRITSNSGNIAIRGKATPSNTWGIIGYAGFNVNSGTGRIVMDGYSTSGQGIDLEGSGSILGTITSAAVANATPAISLIGKSDTTGDSADRGLYITRGITISATGGGDVSLTGDNAAVPSSNVGSIFLFASDILANTGKVTLNGGSDGVVTSNSGETTNLGALSSGSASGNVSIIGDRISGAGTTNIKTTGDVVLESSSTTFASAMSLGAFGVTGPAANLRVGKSTNDKDVTLGSGTTSVTGAVEVYGANLTLNGSITTSATSGTGLLFKAKGDIVTGVGTAVARAGFTVTGANSTAPITFWSNTDAANGGSIQIGNYTDISTTGAAITLAGSAASTDTSPTGYAEGSTSTNCTGLALGSSAVATDSVKISSAGGNILLRGKSSYDASACVGLKAWSGINVNSGTGSITADGLATGSTTSNFIRHGLDFHWTGSSTGSFTSTWTSAKESGTAISMTGTSNGTSNNGRGVISWAGSNLATISATGGGDIAITGTASTNTTQAVSINFTNIYADGGAINISGGAKQVAFGETGANNIGGETALTDAGEITVRADSISIAATAGSAAFKNAAKLSLISDGVKFSSAQTLGAGASVTNIGALQVGLSTNTADVSMSGAYTVGGPISIYGGNLALTAGLAVTPSTTGSILLKATGDIATSGARTFSTQGGDVTLWADSDNSGAGRIGLDTASTISSKGGKITLAGGSDDGASTVVAGRVALDGYPDGYAAGNGSTSGCSAVTGTVQGVFLGTTTTLSSEGGDVFIAGRGLTGATVQCAGGIRAMQDLWITAGSGKVGMYGKANAATSSVYSAGIALYGNSSRKTIISTSNSAADALVVSGDAGPTASSRASGIFTHGQSAGANVNNIFANTGRGGVQIIGRSVPVVSDTLGDNVGDGVEFSGTAVLAKSGDIVITGTTGAAANSDRYGFGIDHGTAASQTNSSASFGARSGLTVDNVDMSTSTSNVTINCDSLIVGSTVQAHTFLTAGKVTIQPADGAQSFDRTVALTGLNIDSGVTGITVGQSGTGGTVSGVTQNNTDFTISSALTAAGPIEIYGKSITVSANLTTSTASRILLKGTENVSVDAGTSNAVRRTLSTNSGAITLWSNADVTGLGKISIGNYTELSSKAGAITLAGSTVATEATPTGYATAGTNGFGVSIGTSQVATDSVKLTTTSGDITIRGKLISSTGVGMGLAVQSGANITSTSGAIVLDGASYQPTGTQGHATYLNLNGGYTSTITTGKSTGTAIDIKGVVESGSGSSTNAYGVLAWLGTGANNISATGGGDVKITGVSATNTPDAIALNMTKISATSGNIKLDGGNQLVILGENGANTIGGVTLAGDHTGDITICAGDIVFDASYWTYLRTAGNLVIEPCSGSFTKAQKWLGTDVSMTAKSARFGRTGNSADIEVSAAMTLTGDLEVIGGAITYNGAGVTSTGATSDVTITASGAYTGPAAFNAGGNITVSSAAFSGTGALTAAGNLQVTSAAFSGSSALTAGGNVVVNSAAFTGSGAIQATGKVAVTATTFDGTGAITSAGADGIAVTTTAGDLDTGANMSATTVATAPITLKSTGNILLGNNLTSAGGPITLWSDSDELSYGGILTAASSTITSNGGAVTLSGGANPTSGYAKATTLITSTANPAYSGVRLLGKIVSGAGDVTLRGQDNPTIGTSSHNSGISAEKTASVTTTSGDVTMDGALANALTDTGNRIGVILGWGGTATTGTNAFTTTSGDISIKGSAASWDNARGYGVWLFATAISSTSGAINIEGDGTASSAYDLWVYGADISSATGAVTARTGTTGGKAAFDLAGSRISSGTSVTLAVKTPTFSSFELAGAGTKTIEPPTGATSFGAAVNTTNVTISSTSTALTVGSSTNTASVTFDKATSIAGPITVYGGDVTNLKELTATGSTGSISINSNGLFTNSAAISSAGGNQPTTIKADKASLGGSINSGTGITTITGFTAAKTIDLGLAGDTTATLALTNAELGTITAGTIRVGDSTSGNITVSASITIAPEKSNTLALRTAGNVTATNSSTVNATNLGIAAGGTITLGGSNNVSGNLAIVAAGAAANSGSSFGSSGPYTAAAVDGITPVFGIGKNITLSSAPAVGTTEVRYLNQTWSAPPVVTVKDEYGYVISANNRNKSNYTTTITGSGDPTIAGATASVVGGTQTFGSLKFTTTPGEIELTFTTAGLAAGGTSTATTGTYDVQGGEPTSIVIAKTSASAPARKIGFGLTATLKDAGGNTVSGPHATDPITVSVAEVNADADSTNNPTIHSGGTASTVGGVADFSNLALSGKVLNDYRLTFSVTFLDSGNVSRTITATEDVTVTHGDAHHLSLAVASSLINDTEFGTQPVVRIFDADDNLVTTGAESSQQVTLTATGATIGGTTYMNANQGVANFANKGVKLTGLSGAKTLTAAISSPSAISQSEPVTISYGAAHHVELVTEAANALNGSAFGVQPIAEIRDISGNLVANSTLEVTASVTPNGTLTGGFKVDAVGGVATFQNLGLTAPAGTKTLTFTAATLSGVDWQNILAVTGAPTRLRIDVASTLVNDTVFATQPVVTLLDSTNTIVSVGAYSTQRVTLSSPDADIAGTLYMDAEDGVANFDGLGVKLKALEGLRHLKASISSPNTVEALADVTITFGAATQLSIASGASDIAANRIEFGNQPAVKVLDISGNLVADSTATIDVTATGANGAVLGGDTSMAAVGGIAYFNLNNNKLKLSGQIGDYTLYYDSSNLTGASEGIELRHGTAVKIVLTEIAAGAKSGQDFTTQPTLKVRDADNNLVDTGAAASAEIKVTTTAAAYNALDHTGVNLTGPANSDVVSATAGVATFAGLRLEGVVALAYNLTFTTQNTAGYNGFTTTQNIALAAGTQTQLRVVEQPSNIVAGVTFATAVKAEILDTWKNRVLDVANTVTVKPTMFSDALATTSIDATKSAVANSSGLVTFTGLYFTKAGTHYIQFTSDGLTAVTSSAFNITNAEADHLTWIVTPVGAKNDYAIRGAGSADPELEVRDQFENPVLVGAATTVAVTEQTSTADVKAISGASATSDAYARVKFTNLVMRAKAATYDLDFTASNGNLAINGDVASDAVTITFGDPYALNLTRDADGATSGAPFAVQPTLDIVDSADNVVADSTLSVTASETETQVLSGTRTVPAVAGQVDFTGSGMMLSGDVATGLTLKYAITFNGTEISTTQTIDLDPGLAVALTIGQQPTDVRTRDAFSPVPTVILRDASNNHVTTDSASTVTAQLMDGAGLLLGNPTSAFTASGGVVTFTGLSFTAPSTTGYRVQYTLGNNQTVTSNTFTILPGAATELRIVQAPATVEANQARTMTGEVMPTQPIVELRDFDGNLVTTTNSGVATIRVKTGAGGDLSAGSTTAPFVGGIATFSGVKLIGTPGVDYVLEFTNANPALTSPATNPIRVAHNVADHIVLTQSAANGKSGMVFGTQPIVTVQDRYGNTVTNGPGSDATVTVSAAITAQDGVALSPPRALDVFAADLQAVSGVARYATVGLTGLVSNTYELNYSVDLAGISAVTQSNISISYGTFHHLTLRTPPVGGNATGDALSTQPVVELRDSAENLVADPQVQAPITASISSSDGLVLRDHTDAHASPARLENVTAISNTGVATFTDLKLYGLPGTAYTLKFANNARFTTASGVTVTHAAAHHLTVTQQPTGGNATGQNLAGQPVVELRDLYENVVTSNSTDVLTARIATTPTVRVEGATTATFSQGVATFAGLKVIALPGLDYNLDFTTMVGSTALTSPATSNFQVTWSTATKLAVVTQPSGGTTGVALNTQPVVEVRDYYGNRVFDFVGNITAAVGGSNSTLTSASASNLQATVVDGRASFTDLALTATPAVDYQLTFSSGALTSINSDSIRVIPGAPVRIAILNEPIGAETGALLAGQPVVHVVDTFGNRVTQDQSTVITAELSAGTGGTLTRVVGGSPTAIEATVVNGVATFSNLVMRGLTSQNYKLAFSSGDLLTATSANFTVHHAAVATLEWNTQPQVGMTGSPLTRAAVLELKDMDGNIATDDVTTVVTAVVTSGTGARALQSATAVADHGIVTFTNLTLTGTPGTTYKLTFTGVIGGASFAAPESNGLVLTHAVPAKVVMVGGNVNGGLTGELLTDQPVLQVRDRFDNLATSDSSTEVSSSIFHAANLSDGTGRIDEGATATARNGIVTFTGLKVSGDPGKNYTLRFAATWSGTSLTGDISNEFHVSKVAALTLSYDAQDFSLNAVARARFYTDSQAGYTFSTNASSLICVLDRDTGDLTIKGAGNCVVNVAIDTDDDGFYLANTTSATLVINKAQQAPVTITSAANVNYWSGLNPVAAGGSGTGLYSFEVYRGDPVQTVVNGVTTVTYENPSTCRLIGATIIPGDAGSLCRITATRAGDINYLPRTSEIQVITVNKIQQAPLAIASPETMSVDNLNLFTSGGSGSGAVTYRIVSAGTSRCSVTAAVLSAASSGTCKVKATKAASTNYESITSPDVTIRVTKEAQTVAFTSTTPMNPTIRGTYAPTAVATSGLAVTYSVATGSSCEVDSLVPGKINFTASGMCELVATQAGSSRYAAAEARQFIQVGAYNQTIRFDVIPDLAFGTPAFKVAPTTNAGVDAPIVLSTTGNSTACTLAGDIVTLTAAGICEIAANQAGYGSFLAATEVVRTFKVVADLAGAPQIFSSSVATHSLTASFTAPSYTGGSPITGYVLVATDTAGNSYENAACGPVSAASVTCTIVGIPNDVAYTAVARAITSAGRGVASNVTMSQTPKDAPMAVTDLAASSTTTGMTVTWTPPVTANGLDALGDNIISGYDIYVAPIGGEFPTTTPYSVSGANTSSKFIADFALTTPSVAPSASPSPEPTVTTASAQVTFRRASVNGSSSAPTAPSASNTPMAPAAPAGYQIRIVTRIGDSRSVNLDNTTSGFQTNFAVPLSPSQLNLTPTGTDLVISWTAPTADGGKPVVGYNVKVNNTVICPATTLLFCTYSDMKPGLTYNVEVFAINAIGMSAASVSSHAVPALPAPPVGAPSSPSATPTPTPTPKPTATPTISPTPKPTVKPTVKPTTAPTTKPTTAPIAKPAEKPTAEPSPSSSSTAEPVVPVEPTEPETPVLPEESEPFDPMGSPESIKAVTETTAKAAAIAAAMAAAAAAGAAAAGRAGGSSGGGSGSSDPGSIATIDATHEQYELRRRGRGDRLKVWRRRWMRLLDKISIRATLLTAPVSPVLSRIVVDGAYLRAAAGIFASLPTIAAAAIAATALAINGTAITTPIWQLFLAITLIGIFDAFAGMVGTAVFVIGSFAIHALAGLPIGMGDVRMMLGVIIVGFGPALLANSFRVFRKVPEKGSFYVWERIVDLGVLPFIGGWVTATMISTLPALAGMTLVVADHVNDFALAVAAAIVIRVIGEELVAREFPERLDTLHPTEVPATPGIQRWISLGFRLTVFIFVTAALMGNEWQVWVGSVLFVLPTMLGWWQDKFPNSKWVWRIMPQGIPGLAFTLLVASVTTNIVSGWFEGTPEAALWSFALLPIPMLALSILGLIGREGDEDEVRWIRQPRFVWVYRIGGIIMLVLTMKVAGVI